ncbi:ABC transporter ATP-binding protein [Arthrobacter sp. GMC3]|uniref:ABC transporter ATP-binding protein n=1 Tax=Arthrobacter sp. GMC3 TaxID=2058894 RepID=UPI000CE4BCA5|nr:ATP-binding cassette domain-containing protein [Arthrobacter sp. GMC3]
MSTLEFRDLWVRFGSGHTAFDAVRGVNLTVASGKVVGLVGESGSGKSTIARTAVGLSEPHHGQILLDGVDVAHAKGSAVHARQRIQMVFQDPYSCLDPRMSIGASIREAIDVTEKRKRRESANYQPLSRAARDARVGELLALVELDPARASAFPGGFSGGQRQRVALARALAAEPDVLLADEITSALDVSVQGTVLNLLLDLQKQLNLTVLFISHNLAVVSRVCDEIVVMNRGEIIEHGPTSQVIDNPQDPYTQELIEAVPQIGVPLFG